MTKKKSKQLWVNAFSGMKQIILTWEFFLFFKTNFQKFQRKATKKQQKKIKLN